MALPDITPQTQQATDVASHKVLINDKALSGEASVFAISISTVLNKISTATVVLHDGEVSQREFKLSNSDEFKPGNRVEIQLGYHGEVKTVFKGIITKHALRAKQKDSSLLFVEAKNQAVKLTIGRKNKYFIGKKDSDIIDEICTDAKIKVEKDNTTVTHKEMVQYYSTDWDFILQRAEANGMLVHTDFENVIIKKPNTGATVVMTATYGDNIFEFETEMDARQQFKSVKTHSWNFSTQKIEDSEEGSSSFSDNGNISNDDLAKVIGVKELSLHHAGNVNDDELKQWADAYAMKSKLSKICGKLKVAGNPDVKPGSVITIKGLSDRFNGNVFVTGVQQQFSVDHWFTEIQFGWNNDWFYKTDDIIEKPSGGLVPGINGLHTGIVTKLESDPDGEHRIRVRVPLISMDGDGIWARIATLDAGKDRGSFFLPEINDEVVLGFINDDPRHAIILGMLHSQAKPAPVTASDQNNEKGFYSRSKMKLVFDDDKKSISLITPGGNSLIMEDQQGSIEIKDKSGNKIKLSSDGITIESSTALKAKGNTQVELTSSATTTIKGTMVQIN